MSIQVALLNNGYYEIENNGESNMSRQNWYRKQASLFAQRLTEYLEATPGRMTKARKAILNSQEILSQNFRNEEVARWAISETERLAWQAPEKACRVIVKALRPSESYNEFLNGRN
jgi:hypothetical protein|tara:strand:- start:82 stop:429 length:348 start_codon:yes stop_codon:yes gene_type:complete